MGLGNGGSTWVHFLVRRDSVNVNQLLEALGEFVGSVESGGVFVSFDDVQKREHWTSRRPLGT